MSTAKIFRIHFSPKKKIWLGGWPLWKIQTYQIYIANLHALDNSSKQFYPSEAPPPSPYKYRIRAWHCLELYTRCCLFSYQDKNWIINTSIPNEVFRIFGINDFLPKCLWIILKALFTHELTAPTNYETIFVNYLRN